MEEKKKGDSIWSKIVTYLFAIIIAFVLFKGCVSSCEHNERYNYDPSTRLFILIH